MKQFNEAFRTKLYETIETIENNSLVEIVVIIKAQSDKYKDIPLLAGIVFSFLLYTFFMFSPFEFDVFINYVFTLLSFFAVFGLFASIPFLHSLLIKKAKKQKAVEIAARAIFQKGGIRFTNDKIGTLIYVSYFEKQVYILPDRGAKTAVPDEEWKTINENFQSIFNSQNIADELINQLANCKDIFSKYIPPIENDINELPDNLDVEL